MSNITRKLTFHSEHLETDATLIFLFDDYKTKHDPPLTTHPVVWKKAFFGGTGNYSKTLEYSDRLTFTKPDPGDLRYRLAECEQSNISLEEIVESGLSTKGAEHTVEDLELTQLVERDSSSYVGCLRPPAPWDTIEEGQVLELVRTADGNFKLISKTVEGSTGLVLRNKSGVRVDVALGFQRRDGALPQLVRVFRNLGDGSSVDAAGFKPILRVCVTSKYDEGDVLLSPLSGEPIWSQNLDGLAEETEWKVTYDLGSGKFGIYRTG